MGRHRKKANASVEKDGTAKKKSGVTNYLLGVFAVGECCAVMISPL